MTGLGGPGESGPQRRGPSEVRWSPGRRRSRSWPQALEVRSTCVLKMSECDNRACPPYLVRARVGPLQPASVAARVWRGRPTSPEGGASADRRRRRPGVAGGAVSGGGRRRDDRARRLRPRRRDQSAAPDPVRHGRRRPAEDSTSAAATASRAQPGRRARAPRASRSAPRTRARSSAVSTSSSTAPTISRRAISSTMRAC